MLIRRLIEGGHAYPAAGDVYFDVHSYPAYGALSGQRLDQMRPAEDADDVGAKRDPRDFTLWKAAKPGEPYWETPWGPGRPGWHLECSAMSTKYLGPDLRHPRRRDGPDLPAPRERDRAVPGGRRRLRPVLDAQRPARPGRGEDEQVAGQLAAGHRRADPGAAAPSCATTWSRRTTGRCWSSPRTRWRRRPPPTSGSSASWCGPPRCSAARDDADDEPGDDEPPGLPTSFRSAMDEDLAVPAALAAVHACVRDGNQALAASDKAGVRASLVRLRAMLDVLGLDPLAPHWAGSAAGLRAVRRPAAEGRRLAGQADPAAAGRGPGPPGLRDRGRDQGRPGGDRRRRSRTPRKARDGS